MSESQYNHPDNVARRIAKSIADQSFDDETNETIDEDEEFLLAYGDRWCKQKYGELGYPSPGSPNAALLVLHDGLPRDITYCPWCKRIHYLCAGPDNWIEDQLWGTEHSPCQSLRFTRGLLDANFPSAYHPDVLYDCQQKFIKEGVTDHRDRLMDTYKRVSREPIGYICELPYLIDFTRKEYPKYKYEVVTEWKHSFNQHGIFLVRRREVPMPPEGEPKFLFEERTCGHMFMIVDFAQLQNPEANSAYVNVYDVHKPAGIIHGCDLCVIDSLLMIDKGSSDSVDPPRTPKVIMTTWFYLGKGGSPTKIDDYKRNIKEYITYSPGKLKPKRDVAKLSGLLEWGTSYRPVYQQKRGPLTRRASFFGCP